MFFSDRIVSIGKGDRVLEIGPGSTPHPLATEFLEYRFEDDQIALMQRGNVHSVPNFGDRRVSYYQGDRFPFKDNEFKYVILSHVIEHTVDPIGFMREVFRVGGGRGYIEFPLPPYEYLFDFDVHLLYVWFDEGSNSLFYSRKSRALLDPFSSITREIRRGFELGWDDVVRNNLDFFIQGFEFSSPFSVREAASLVDYKFTWNNRGDRLVRRVIRKVEAVFSRK